MNVAMLIDGAEPEFRDKVSDRELYKDERQSE